MKMKISGIFLFIILLVTSCSPSPEALATQTAGAWTPTPEVTVAPVLEPITGKLFWDANGSGLLDETSFIMPENDLKDLPYFFELLASQGADVGAFKPGELTTVSEPDIPGMKVCVGDACTVTDDNGEFTISLMKHQTKYKLTFEDPNESDPEKEFRYLNKWNGAVVVVEYEVDGVVVPEQQLNDTEIVELDSGVRFINDEENAIGLVQGFLTLPYRVEDANNYWISNFYDLDTNVGKVRNYLGSQIMIDDPSQSKGIGGTSDAHSGIDFEGPIGLFVISPIYGEVNGIYNNDSLIVIAGQNGTAQEGCSTNCGHLKNSLVTVNQKIYLGQIIGINGKTGTSHPHIHFSLNNNKRQLEGVDAGMDPFMDLIENTPNYEISQSGGKYVLSEMLIGSPGFWTVINLPQFPLVEVVE